MTTKLAKMQTFLPQLYRPTQNPVIRGVLSAWGDEDDRIVESIRDARDQIFVIAAQLRYLDALGSNVGVFRPTAFNLSDALYRRLIPALSFSPKQVIPTIQKVLDIFFEENNPRVRIAEIRPNQIEISIPSSVPALRRSLRGSHHFHVYSGTIVSVDNLFKEMVVDLDNDTKSLDADEFADALIGQGLNAAIAISNTSGSAGVTIQFGLGEDLSAFSAGGRWVASLGSYPGSFIPDPTRAYTATKQRGVLGQSISAGSQVPTLTMTDASGIPDAVGRIAFNLGFGTEEVLVRYFGRPNNSTLLIDPGHVFAHDHSPGEPVNVVLTPYLKPRKSGFDYSIYLVGVTAARILAQQIVQSIVASGVVINWTIISPEINC